MDRNKTLLFKPVDVERDLNRCIKARRDAYFCSFGTYEGVEQLLDGYTERVIERSTQDEWYYVHVWMDGGFAGQLEFRCFSPEPEPHTGYVHLIYLCPEYRGQGLAKYLQHYIKQTLLEAECSRAVLSVSRDNVRALRFYQRHGWQYLRPNLKHSSTDFYCCHFH